MRKKTLLIAIVAFVSMTAAAMTGLTQRGRGRGQAPPLDIREVVDGLYVIVGSGGNVSARVTSEGIILIDDKFERNYDEIVSKIGSVTDQPVKYVINTHHHGDHTGGNANFSAIAQVIAHTNVRANILRNEQAGPPSIVYTDQASVHLGGVEARAIHLGRGHTDGDSVVYFPDLRVVHTGDLFITDGGPLIDYANGGDSTEWLDTLDRIAEIDADTFVSGHGEVATKAELREFRRNLQMTQQRTREAIRNGATKENLAERVKLDDLGWAWEGRLLRSLDGFYDEMATR